MNTIKTKNTVSVFARHKDGCMFDRPGDRACKCPKYLLVYEADHKKNRMESARTTSWVEAEACAKDMRESWDLEKIELKQLRAKKELEQVSMVDAICLYVQDMKARLGDGRTVEATQSFWGEVDPITKDVVREGNFFAWTASLPADTRAVYVRDVTPQHLTAWRASWKYMDSTASTRWTMVKAFFSFCEGQGWIEDNPGRKMKPLKVKKGNRTSIFTDTQYEAILDAASAYAPEHRAAEEIKHRPEQVRTFIELLRWSAMSPVDAIEFRPEMITGNVLRYRRQKTRVLATVKLPDHVIAALRSVPLEAGCTVERPFRTKNTAQASNVEKWGLRLTQVFQMAGITEVQTDFRVRKPHMSMFRDTAAVWWLRHHVPVHSVAKALGHASVTTTERAYLPWVKELEDSHIEAMDKVMEAAAPKVSRGVTTIRRKA
jgi:integrase